MDMIEKNQTGISRNLCMAGIKANTRGGTVYLNYLLITSLVS